MNHLRIGQRLALGFGLVIFLLVLLAGLSITRLASLNKEMDALIHLRDATTVSANAVKADVNDATRAMLGVLVMTDPEQVRKQLAHAARKSKDASAAVARLARSTADAEAVAAEVRRLAQRPAAAAREIKVLIGDSGEKVREGSLLVEQAGATMREVVDSVRRVTDIMAEISAASAEQSAGIAQVSRNVAGLDHGTRKNAALVEEAAAAAASMQEQAAQLAHAVSIFT